MVEKNLSAEGRLKLLRALVGHRDSLTMAKLSKITELHTTTIHQHLKSLVKARLRKKQHRWRNKIQHQHRLRGEGKTNPILRRTHLQ
ncbi:MAG: ArsR family transcriptional regulator [Candidatus Jordarchaeum sp.]|uniref:ArsR family transcriptional regulator n=1 Tax=Candidatus Jordarchaeum sp. TaxID=2823881 RepID=UPI00404B071C